MEAKSEAGNAKNFRGMKLPGADFSSKDLRGANFRGASLVHANFTGSDLTYASFEGANLHGADFTDAKCMRTNFKDADLSHSKMHAKDLFGATFTFECRTFEGMKVLPGWWYGFLYFATLMEAPSKEFEDKLILLIGIEHYQALCSRYTRRG